MGHSSVECPVHEIPRWTVPHTRQRLGSPVEFFSPCITCWSRGDNQLCGDGHSTPLVFELECVNFLVKISCQGRTTEKGQSGS